MTDPYQRYAIYWVPEAGSGFAAFGKQWFGGEAHGLPPELAARAIKEPAHYGLHATLKAPFRLAAQYSQHSLQAAIAEFCGKRRKVRGKALAFATLQDYLVLALRGSTADIDWLADECVVHFDRFRAPGQREDRERRFMTNLSSRETSYLEAFGYPYILADFRFHISLAGLLSDPELAAVEKALAPVLAPLLGEPFTVAALTLLGEPSDGRPCEVLSTHPFVD